MFFPLASSLSLPFSRARETKKWHLPLSRFDNGFSRNMTLGEQETNSSFCDPFLFSLSLLEQILKVTRSNWRRTRLFSHFSPGVFPVFLRRKRTRVIFGIFGEFLRLSPPTIKPIFRAETEHHQSGIQPFFADLQSKEMRRPYNSP